MSPIHTRYRDEIRPGLAKQLGYDNLHAVPRLAKIVVSMGVGTKKAKDVMDVAAQTVATITGQKPVRTKARKAVAAFHTRRGMDVGLRVTLRGRRMYEFFDRLVNIAIPRIRDFQGLPRDSFDRAGNYTLGITEQAVFPEIHIDKVEHTLGLQVTLCIEAKRTSDSEALLRAMGLPLKREGE